MARKFSELRAKLPAEAQALAAARAEATLVEMRLQELRRARGLTQVEVAEAMHSEQTAVSERERREDMDASTLREDIEAPGGELKLVASFPDAEIPLHPFDSPR